MAPTHGDYVRRAARWRRWPEQERAGWAGRQTVRGGGAEWTKTQAAPHFPTAAGILDWGYPARAGHQTILVAHPGRTNRQVYRPAQQLIPALLWDGEMACAATELADLLPARCTSHRRG